MPKWNSFYLSLFCLNMLPMFATKIDEINQNAYLNPNKKEMATHSSTLAWKIPWVEEPDRLQSTRSQRMRHDWATFFLSKNHWLNLFTISDQSVHSSFASFFSSAPFLFALNATLEKSAVLFWYRIGSHAPIPPPAPARFRRACGWARRAWPHLCSWRSWTNTAHNGAAVADQPLSFPAERAGRWVSLTALDIDFIFL